MTDLAYTIAPVAIALLAWDGWRRYLAHRERVTNDSIAAVRVELTKWQDTVTKCVETVNALQRSSVAGLGRLGKGKQ